MQPDSIFTSSSNVWARPFAGFSVSEINSIDTSSKETELGGGLLAALASEEMEVRNDMRFWSH